MAKKRKVKKEVDAPQEKKSPFQRLEDTMDSIHQIHEDAKAVFNRLNCLCAQAENALVNINKDSISNMKMIQKKFDEQQAILNEATRISASTEETLLNVLLAIRQNEYLQAWYPEQQGHPATKVVGTHPINLKQKKAA